MPPFLNIIESFNTLSTFTKPWDEIPLGVTSVVLIWMLLCLIISAICSSSENAFFSHRESDLEELSESGTKKHLIILKLLGNPKRLLATMLLMNSLANIAFIISSLFFYDLVLNDNSHPLLKLLIDTVLVTLIILIFGEVIPKVYATHYYRKTAEFLVYPMRFFVWILWPFTSLLEKLGGVLEKRAKNVAPEITAEEITEAIELTSNQDDIIQEKDILKGIVNMSTIQVKQIMCSRMDVIALEEGLKFNEILQVAREYGFSRMPVYKESLDKILGVLNVKSLLPHLEENEDFKWTDLVYPPYFVPENKSIDDLLSELQQKRLHMAIVVDEFGGTSGVVTLEDLLEEVFGELKDEFDDESAEFEKISDDVFVFEGKTLLVDFLREMDLKHDFFSHLELDSDTLSGFISEELGQIPKRGEKIKVSEIEFIVEEADPKKVRKVKVIFTPQNENKLVE